MGRGNSAAGGLEASVSSLSLLLCVGWTDKRTSLTLCLLLSTWGCGESQIRPYRQSCFNACFENNTLSQHDLTIREQLGPAWIPCLHGCDFIPEKSKWKQEKLRTQPARAAQHHTAGTHTLPPSAGSLASRVRGVTHVGLPHRCRLSPAHHAPSLLTAPRPKPEATCSLQPFRLVRCWVHTAFIPFSRT